MMTPRISRRISTSDKFRKDESGVRQTNLELKIAGQGFTAVHLKSLHAFSRFLNLKFHILDHRFVEKKIVCNKPSLIENSFTRSGSKWPISIVKNKWTILVFITLTVYISDIVSQSFWVILRSSLVPIAKAGFMRGNRDQQQFSNVKLILFLMNDSDKYVCLSSSAMTARRHFNNTVDVQL